MQCEQWSGLEKTKKKRRKRKKQTCGLVVLPMAVDGVAVVDRGADWPVVLLSFSAFTFYFFSSYALFFLLFPVLFFLSLSGPLKHSLELLPEDEDKVKGDQCFDRATFLSFLMLLFSFLILLFLQFLFALFFFFVSGFWNDEDDGNAGFGLNDFLCLHSFLLLISVSLSCYSLLSLLSC